MKNIAAYVPQEDHLLENLTVKETLTYSALLRLPSAMSHEEKLQQVDRVIQELRLTHIADSKIGGEFIRGISGGEKRRVSIGLQLLTNPSKKNDKNSFFFKLKKVFSFSMNQQVDWTRQQLTMLSILY
jgi:ABC-type multidrug transport system ATPase subunit